MSPDTLHQKQLLPTDQRPLQQIPTILICKNSLVHTGIRHILKETRFRVAEEIEDSSKLPVFPDAPPALCIVSESHAADALAEMVAGLKAQSPSVRVVVFADHLNPRTVMRLLQAGTNGFSSTRMDRDALIKALELVMLGETFIPAALALTVLHEMPYAQGDQWNMAPALSAADDPAMRDHNLSSREVEILRRLIEGETNKVIARKLNIAEATIKSHVKTILRKVRATNRTQAALWAAEHLNAASDSRHGTQGGK